jgi:hypothetical protein
MLIGPLRRRVAQEQRTIDGPPRWRIGDFRQTQRVPVVSVPKVGEFPCLRLDRLPKRAMFVYVADKVRRWTVSTRQPHEGSRVVK